MIEELYRLAIAQLKQHLQTAGVPFQEDDGDLRFNGHRLGISIAFDGLAQQGEQTIAPVEIQIHLDGDTGDRFRIGTLGVGRDASSAIRTAVDEWHVLAAAPLLAALGAPLGERRRDRIPRQLAGWDFFPGRMGIRGSLPAQFQDESGFYRLLLSKLQHYVSSWPEPEDPVLRSILIMATTAEGPSDVQVAVDGLVERDLAAAFAELDWPSGGEPYFLKQFFVLRHAGPKPSAPAKSAGKPKRAATPPDSPTR